MMRSRLPCGAWALLALAVAAGCGDEPPPATATPPEAATLSPSAQLSLVEELKRDLALVHHPSDGAGRAWIETAPDAPPARASTPGRWTIHFETGPLGIAEGGRVFLEIPPFWGWSTPQVEFPEAPGYTTIVADLEGVELSAARLDQQLLGVEVRGRALVPGERLRFVYGAGPAGALADRMAERGSRFWVAVDGDGDGIRAVLPDSPAVEVHPGPPARLNVALPSTARPGERVRLTLAVLDASGNSGIPFTGSLELEVAPPLAELPSAVTFEAGDLGSKALSFSVAEPGIYRVRARGPVGLEAESNPLVVAPDIARVFWGDLHGHSNFSDGTGTPEDYFRYARDVAALDVVALTDHDHWGMLFLDAHPEMWETIRTETKRFHQPGRFVTLLGYEWTSWLHGHRHVLYFGDDGALLSSLDPDYESPARLWEGLRGQPALTFAHHSAGGPVATNWSIPPDPELEPVTEVVSVHGVSEALDSPHVIYSAVAGNFVRDVLDRGITLGFIGSGDSHDGHPGLAQIGAPTGGLAAFFAAELTRESILSALRARQVYATSGPRILLRARLGVHPMGSRIPSSSVEPLVVTVVSPGALDRVEIIRSGALVDAVPGEGSRDLTFERSIHDLRAGEYLYLRVIQQDLGIAWSSPFFIVP